MDDTLVAIADIGPELGVNPSAFFQAACRGEIQLTRIGRRWACRHSDALAFAERRHQRIQPSPGILGGTGPG